ncbi:hypothetical protein MANES_07G063594v8 [Manihot esculenta]|uniref:Uncharacterized protein n=1 Tax=Manihot esculenta TaxID=3983 RepID=A0ACB7HFX8_MANES|nr:hypothetical protein MANES_07G063594v8 [Manihot esculenta]
MIFLEYFYSNGTRKPSSKLLREMLHCQSHIDQTLEFITLNKYYARSLRPPSLVTWACDLSGGIKVAGPLVQSRWLDFGLAKFWLAQSKPVVETRDLSESLGFMAPKVEGTALGGFTEQRPPPASGSGWIMSRCHAGPHSLMGCSNWTATFFFPNFFTTNFFINLCIFTIQYLNNLLFL